MQKIDLILLSVIQGLTEFLPVSSSGHLVLLPKLVGFEDPGLELDAFLHLGTLFAALIYFRQEIIAMLLSIFSLGKAKSEIYDFSFALGLVLASLPAALLGLGFKDFFAHNDVLRSAQFIALTLILGAFLLALAEWYQKRSLSSKSISDLNWPEMFFVGCMQVLALFPGTSRSGITLTAGLFLKMQRDQAAKFAFIVGLPVITGAGLLATKDLLELIDAGVNQLSFVDLGIGFVVSFVTGIAAIHFMIKFLKTNSSLLFIIYRLILGVVLLVSCF